MPADKGTTTQPVSINESQPKEQGDKGAVQQAVDAVGQGNAEREITVLDEKPTNNNIKITQDGNEQQIAEQRLTAEDNHKQEPVIKAIEGKAESDRKTGLIEAVGEAGEVIKESTAVVDMPISEIKTDTEKYQNRVAPFSEKSANKVATQYNPNKFDPIVLYKHPDGNTYVLSGHSRFEGMRRRGEKTIPARFFEGTPKEAEEFAQKSNKFNDLNSEIESAAYYRKMREDGHSISAIDKEAKEQEQQGAAKRVIALSHLNPKGKAYQALEALDKGEGDTKDNIVKVAQKVGEIRKQNSHLTDAHENELFEHFVKDADNIPTDKELNDQNSLINRSIASVRFDNKEPLNLQKFTPKSGARLQWEKEKAEIENQLTDLKKAVNPNKTTGWTGLKERAISSLSKSNSKSDINQAEKEFNDNKGGIKDNYNNLLAKKKTELSVVQNKLAKHLLQEKNVIEVDKAQISLFNATTETKEVTPEQKEAANKILDFLKKKIPFISFITDAKEYAETLKEILGGNSVRLQALQKQYDFLFNGKSVADISGKEFEKKEGVTLKQQINNFFNSIGNKANSVFGEVTLDNKAFKDDSFHGLGREKVITFKALPEILKNGIEVLPMGKHKAGENTTSGMIAAPITIDGKEYVAVAVVRQNLEGNKRLYVHEVTLKEKLLDGSSKPALLENPTQATNQGAVAKVLKDIVDAKNNPLRFASQNFMFGQPNVQYTQKWDERAKKAGFIKDITETNPKVTGNDYFFSTKGTFEETTIDEFDKIDAPEINPPHSVSSYKIKDGYLYRCSNHWGTVATCTWLLADGDGNLKNGTGKHKGEYTVGKVKLSDLSRKSGVNIFEVPKGTKKTFHGLTQEQYIEKYGNKNVEDLFEKYGVYTFEDAVKMMPLDGVRLDREVINTARKKPIRKYEGDLKVDNEYIDSDFAVVAWENENVEIVFVKNYYNSPIVVLVDKSSGASIGRISTDRSEYKIGDKIITAYRVMNANIYSARGQGYGQKMYQALIDFADADVSAIYSPNSSRINRAEVPHIWKNKLGAETMNYGDYVVRFLSTPQGDILGFVHNGKIYLDPTKLTPKTLAEEFTHIQQQALRLAARKGDKQAKKIVSAWDKATNRVADEFIKGVQGDKMSEYVRDLLNLLGITKAEMASEVYQRQPNENAAAYKTRLQDELWAKAQKPEFAKHLEKLSNENKLTYTTRKIYEALKDFAKYIGKQLGIYNEKEWSKLSLSELIGRTNKELSSDKWLKALGIRQGVSEGIPMFNIVGKNANLSEAQKASFANAEDLDKKGVDAAKIWAATGWQKDKNGKWQTDANPVKVPQSLVDKFKQAQNGKIISEKLGDLVDLGELGNLYPRLAELQVEIFNEKNNNDYAALEPVQRGDGTTTQRIFINSDPARVESYQQSGYYKGERPTSEAKHVPSTTRKVGNVLEKHPASEQRVALTQLLTHEIQHWVQQKEGWPTASNLSKHINGAKNKFIAEQRQQVARFKAEGNSKAAGQAQQTIDYLQYKNANQIADDKFKTALASKIYNEAYENYLNDPGEVQSRNAAIRAFYTAEQKKNIPISESMDIRFQISNSNTNFKEDEKTKYYKDSEGKTIPFKIYSPNDDGAKPNLLQREENKTERDGGFALVERQFIENKNLDFTAGTKIESHNDVAWLFRNLENEAVEHSFVAYIAEDGSYTVQHLGTGGITSTVIDGRLIVGNAVKYGAKSIAFIHNHPSGQLKASNADMQVYSNLRGALDGTGIDIMDGVIINLKSGKYGTFNEDSDVVNNITEQNQEQHKVKVLSFSKQIFAENYNPDKVTSSQDVAKLLSTKKFGVSDKTEILILNNANEVVGKFILPEQNQYAKINELLTQYGGANVIIYGNKIDVSSINEINAKLKKIGSSVLDAIEVKSDNYKSLKDEGLLGERHNIQFQTATDTKPFETADKTPATLENLQEKFKDAEVVQSESELPKAIQDEAKAQKQDGKIKGVYYNGKVYMVADNIKTLGEAEGTYRHETLGHKGVIEYLGAKLDSYAVSVVDNAKGAKLKRLQALAARYGLPTDLSKLTAEQKSKLGQEYIAHVSENKSKMPQTWNKLATFVRKALRALGIKLQVSDTEIQALIGKVEKRANEVRVNTEYSKNALFLTDSDLDENGKPKPEVLKEIEAEKAKIKADAKANGTYHKAPNGKQSNLSEEQWVMVRTKRFKNWFGDWEAEAENNFNFTKNRFYYGYNRDKTRLGNRGTMESSTLNSVVGKQPQRNGIQQTLNANHRSGSNRTGSPIKQAKRFSEGVEKSAKENDVWDNDAVKRFTTGEQIGQGGESEVYLSKDGRKVIKITHLTYFTDTEDLAWKIAAHNRLFELDAYNIIGFTKDKDGRVSVIQEQPYVKATQKATQKQIDDFFIKSGWEKKGEGVFEIGEFRISDALIKEDNDNVLIDNENNLRFIDTFIIPTKQVTHIVSKVVDENGEPLVVGHTTNDEISTFTREKSKEGFYFSAQKDRLDFYNKLNYIPAFLNIKNPIPDIFVSYEKQQEYEKKGYDGEMDFGHSKNKIVENLYEIVVFSPNQIKSATSNVGTFSNESNDIRFSVGDTGSKSTVTLDRVKKAFNRLVNKVELSKNTQKEILRVSGLMVDLGFPEKQINAVAQTIEADAANLPEAERKIISEKAKKEFEEERNSTFLEALDTLSAKNAEGNPDAIIDADDWKNTASNIGVNNKNLSSPDNPDTLVKDDRELTKLLSGETLKKAGIVFLDDNSLDEENDQLRLKFKLDQKANELENLVGICKT